MASDLWLLWRRPGRGLRDDRAAAGNLRSHAPLVRSAFPGDVARILSSRQHNWHGRLLAGRSMGSCGNPLLSDVAAAHLGGDTARENDKSSPPWLRLSQVRSRRSGRDWSRVTVSGDPQLAVGMLLRQSGSVLRYSSQPAILPSCLTQARLILPSFPSTNSNTRSLCSAPATSPTKKVNSAADI